MFNIFKNFFKKKKIDELKSELKVDLRQHSANEEKINSVSYHAALNKIAYGTLDIFKNEVFKLISTIQKLESKYGSTFYTLRTKSKRACADVQRVKHLEEKKNYLEEKIKSIEDDNRKIEKDIRDGKRKGDLSRLHIAWFLGIMTIAGLAEVGVYFNIFLSQEPHSLSDAQDNFFTNLKINGFAVLMSVGFTIVLIWLSHVIGVLIRQFKRSEIYPTIIKVIFISATIGLALYGTIQIRGEMIKILNIDSKITSIKNYNDQNENTEVLTVKTNSDSEDLLQDENTELFSEETSPNSEDLFQEEETQVIKSQDKPNSSANQIQILKDEVVQLKSNLANYFIPINALLIVGGIFLAYKSHVTEKEYEANESIKSRLQGELKDINKNINHYKYGEKKSYIFWYIITFGIFYVYMKFMYKNRFEKMQGEINKIMNYANNYDRSIQEFDYLVEQVKTLSYHLIDTYMADAKKLELIDNELLEKLNQSGSEQFIRDSINESLKIIFDERNLIHKKKKKEIFTYENSKEFFDSLDCNGFEDTKKEENKNEEI